MRLFLGITIPSKIRTKFDLAYSNLKKDYPYFDWVPQENYHVAVAFFGEKDESKLEYISEAIKRSVFDISPFTIFSRETAILVEKNITIYQSYLKSREINKMRERLGDYFEDKEMQNKRRYTPHTTIAKSKLPSKQQYFLIKKKVSKIDLDTEFEVKEIHLFESISKTKQTTYKIIETFKLN